MKKLSRIHIISIIYWHLNIYFQLCLILFNIVRLGYNLKVEIKLSMNSLLFHF